MLQLLKLAVIHIYQRPIRESRLFFCCATQHIDYADRSKSAFFALQLVDYIHHIIKAHTLVMMVRDIQAAVADMVGGYLAAWLCSKL